MRKIVSGVMLTMLLTSMLTLAFNIQPVETSVAVHIETDGSIDWPMFLHDAKHTGRSPYLGPQTNETMWNFRITDPGYGFGANSPVIAADGTVYIGGRLNSVNKFFAINPDGTQKWNYTVPWGQANGIPALGKDGAVVFQTGGGVNNNGRLYCLNSENGTVRWIMGPNQGIPGIRSARALTIGNDGTIYGPFYQFLMAVDPNGTVKWSFSMGGELDRNAPAIGEDGTIYMASPYHHVLYAIHPDGSVAWTAPLGDEPGSFNIQSPAIGPDGTVFVAEREKLYAVTPQGGIDWVLETLVERQVFGYNSPTIGDDGVVYIAANEFGSTPIQLYAINPDGTIRWIFSKEDTPYYDLIASSPSIGSDGTIYFGSHDHCVYALDCDGNLKWKYEAGDVVMASPALGSNGIQLLISSWDGNLYAFGQRPNDLSIISIEPIQVVRNAEALVANKSTVVMATVCSTFQTQVLTEMDIIYDFGTKIYPERGPNDNGIPIDPGINRIYTPGGPAKPTAHPEPWIAANEPPWLLWTKIGYDSNIRCIIDPLDRIPESDATNNEIACNARIVGSKRLRVLVIPLYFPCQDRFDDIPFIREEMSFLLHTYPLADNMFSWVPSDPIRWETNPPPVGRRFWLSSFVAPTLNTLAVLYDFDLVVAVMTEKGFPGGASWEGYADGFWNLDVVFVFKESMLFGHYNTVAHETGHTFYLQHPKDAGPDVYKCQRFSVAERDYERDAYTFMEDRDLPYRNPPSWIDLLRYDRDPWQENWIWTRWNLFDQLTYNPHPDAGQEILLIRTVLFKNGTATIDEPWFRIQERPANIEVDTSGNYSIVLLDAGHQEISRMGFNASFSYFQEINGTWTENETNVFPVTYKVPFILETAFIEVRNSTDHTSLSRAVSPNTPTVITTFPNGGEVLTSGVNCTITWESSDADEDQLSYLVAYSNDGGASWIPITVDLDNTSHIWDTSYLQRGSNYSIKIIATDGVNMGEDVSDNTFTVRVHDVATDEVTCSKAVVGEGFNVTVSMTAANIGDFTETFNATTYANTTLIGKREVTLNAGDNATVTFEWNTTGFAKGNYTLTACAEPVNLEFFTTDNTAHGSAVLVTIAGDVNGDRKVDATDLDYLKSAYGSTFGSPMWNPNCDVNGDGKVEVLDLFLHSKNYGKTDP